MLPHRVPRWVQRFFPDRIWEGPAEERLVYLTFDDGPVPGITDFVLEELAKRDQRATFFMVGDNVRKHSSLALEVLKSGHQVGNHTYNHLHGWKTSTKIYLENVAACDRIFEEKLGIKSNLFRPPYGMLTPFQAGSLAKQKRLVMWSLLSGDYDRRIPAQTLLREIKPKTAPAGIVVFHDQEKTNGHLQKVLPEYLDFLKDQKFSTGVL
jgi:peptidoglycan-N-acetylglucosamine deacetylase